VHRILVTGATGLFAPFAIDAARLMGEVASTSRSGGDFRCDLTNLDQVEKLMREVKPTVVIHGAAMTDVDGCERAPEAAMLANDQATRNIAARVKDRARMVYVSTDQVYPDSPGPHKEGDEAPVNAYGRSKLAPENAVTQTPGGIVARTSFFCASRTSGRRSLSDFVSDNLSIGETITLFTDIRFSPLHAQTLAQLLIEMLQKPVAGVFNVASRAGTTKANFGLEIARHLGLQTGTATLSTSAAVPGRAPRISDLRMDPGKLEQALGHPMPELSAEIAKL
jgi:dTDP-4-dehydrorhamnose reductase